jgi:hypothetical protein
MHLSLNQVNEMLRQLRPYLTENGRLFIDVANPFFWQKRPILPTLPSKTSLPIPKPAITSSNSPPHASTMSPNLPRHLAFRRFPGRRRFAVQRHLSQMAYHYFYPHELELALQSWPAYHLGTLGQL